ncbi:tetratricopeptide TPR_2 repeat protein [gamma proteobacterium HTCC5015]|nr:tetratricopeptide TPR_2 repeat protein [gamma proteobacterium HTCC5015]
MNTRQRRLVTHIKACLIVGLCALWGSAWSAPSETERETLDKKTEQKIEQLEEPLYNPFVERYLLDEVKSLRMEQVEYRNQMMMELRDKHIELTNQAVNSVTSSISNVFYLMALISSLLVAFGWKSIRDIREKAMSKADEKITHLVEQYEKRLHHIEQELSDKSASIEENRIEISNTKEVHSLWLKASQEHSPAAKVEIYDEILEYDLRDTEALTYKADAVLEMGQPIWSLNLCQRALSIDPDNAHANFQAACALSRLGNFSEARAHLKQAVVAVHSYLDLIDTEAELEALRHEAGHADFLKEIQDLVEQPTDA